MTSIRRISADRPGQTVKPSFTEYRTYDFTILWSVFPAVPPPQDFSVKTGDHVVFADTYAEENGDGSFEQPYKDVQWAVRFSDAQAGFPAGPLVSKDRMRCLIRKSTRILKGLCLRDF